MNRIEEGVCVGRRSGRIGIWFIQDIKMLILGYERNVKKYFRLFICTSHLSYVNLFDVLSFFFIPEQTEPG